MNTDWPRVTIEEAADLVAMGPFGSSIKVSTFVPEGVPIISGQHLKGSRVDDSSGHNFITCEHADRLRKANVRKGDVVLTHAGNIGQVAFIPDTAKYDRYVISQRQFFIRCDRTRLSPEFLTYYLQSPEGHHLLMANAVQTGVPSIAQPVSYTRSIEVPLPPIEVQRGIATTLGSLDEKIESLGRLRIKLRSLGFAKFAESIDNSAPEVELASVTSSIARGVTPKYDDANPNSPLVLNQKCIRDGWVRTDRARKMVSRDVAASKKAAAGDILVNSTGFGTLGRVGRWHASEIFVDSHVTVVRPDVAVCPPTLLAYSVLSRQSSIEDMATGSTGQTELSPARLGELTVRLPGIGRRSTLEGTLASIEDLIESTFIQERQLSVLRDLLLEALMSGRLSVSEERELAGVSR